LKKDKFMGVDEACSDKKFKGYRKQWKSRNFSSHTLAGQSKSKAMQEQNLEHPADLADRTVCAVFLQTTAQGRGEGKGEDEARLRWPVSLSFFLLLLLLPVSKHHPFLKEELKWMDGKKETPTLAKTEPGTREKQKTMGVLDIPLNTNPKRP
jgi:hypothetical protein